MTSRGEGSSRVQRESAPSTPQHRKGRKGDIIISNNGHRSENSARQASRHQRRVALEKQQQPSTVDCTVSERSTRRSESGWHVSIQNKDWAQLQKYLEELSSPSHHAHTLVDQSRSDRSSLHRSLQRNNSDTKNDLGTPRSASTPTKVKDAEKKKKSNKRSSAIGHWLKKRTAGSMRNTGGGSAVTSGTVQIPKEEAVGRKSSVRKISYNEDNATSSSSVQHHRQQQPNHLLDRTSLLTSNAAGRTPLQMALNTPEIPDSLLLAMLRAQPQAVSRADAKGRLPLHFAIVKERHMSTIQALVELHVDALYHKDKKGKTPVAYALEVAKRRTLLSEAPKHFWAYVESHHSSEAEWQASQTKNWEVARWFLHTTASQLPQQQIHGHYAYEPDQGQQQSPEDLLVQTNSENNTQPYLIQAMLHAAPPSVVELLINASTSLLNIETLSVLDDFESDDDEENEENLKAISLGCSTFYLAIFRQYPLSILRQMGSLLLASHEVKSVRDETGLGLVSAHYVTKCFEKSKLLEYAAAEDFMVTVEQCIVEGELPRDNLQFIEWWDKLKYLIFFCADKNPDATPDDVLLHAALENSDTPPTVVRLLLALYPGSARRPDAQAAHPLNLFAEHRDYIPRNYESPYMHGLNVMEMLLSLDESAVFHHHSQNRMPLHQAIAAGRTWSTVHPLVSSNRSSLRIPDPVTKLHPPLLAASYREKTEEEEITRLLQLTRNQYSSVVWQGLSENQQQRAVERIRRFESLKRLDTVFELLRRFPQCLEGAVPKPQQNKEHNQIVVNLVVGSTLQKKNHHEEIVLDLARNKTPTQAAPRRESTSNEAAGPEMIAFHYLSWCYKKAHNRWHAVEQNMEILQTNIGVATEHAVLSKKSTDFVNWWGMLKLYFWHCYSAMPSSPEKMDIPREDDYLLHVAVSIPTTPPDLVELILGLFPKSVSLALPETRTYPLHLACQTTTYTPQYFEILKRRSTIETVLHAFPEGVFMRSDGGRMPLHVAIQAGKTLSELGPLIQQGPSLVSAQDPITGLYPFQLMAVSKEPSHDLRLRFQTIASNRHAEGWNRLANQHKVREIKAVENEYEKRVFTSIFELLRLKPAAVLFPKQSAEIGTDPSTDANERISIFGMHFADSIPAQGEPRRRPRIRRHLSGLSRDLSTGSGGGKAAFSTIDMMSTISNVSSHLSLQRRRTVARTLSNKSSTKLPTSAIEDTGGDRDDESEDSDIWSEDMSFHEEIDKQRKIRAKNIAQAAPKTSYPHASTRRQKLKAKWQAPDLFVAESSSQKQPLSQNIPKVVMEPVEPDDDVSLLDGVTSRSISSGRSSLRQSLVREQIDPDDEDSVSGDSQSSDRTSDSDSVESNQSSASHRGSNESESENETIQSVEEDPVRQQNPSLAGFLNGASVTGIVAMKSLHSVATEKVTPGAKGEVHADGVDDGETGDGDDDNDSIQDDIIQPDKKPPKTEIEEEAPAIVFRLRRSSCQRSGDCGGPIKKIKPVRKKTLGGSQQNGSSANMDFLSILNASLPEGRMDYLSTLEVSSTSLPPDADSVPNGLDAQQSKVDRMDQIKEFSSELEHNTKAKQGRGVLFDTSMSKSLRLVSSTSITENDSTRMHMSQNRRRSFDTIAPNITGSPIRSPRPSRGSIHQSITAAASITSPIDGGRTSSLEINSATCNYIGIKPEKLKACLHCGKNSRTVMILPCNHLCLCRVCSDQVEIKSCLLCFGPVAERQNIP